MTRKERIILTIFLGMIFFELTLFGWILINVGYNSPNEVHQTIDFLMGLLTSASAWLILGGIIVWVLTLLLVALILREVYRWIRKKIGHKPSSVSLQVVWRMPKLFEDGRDTRHFLSSHGFLPIPEQDPAVPYYTVKPPPAWDQVFRGSTVVTRGPQWLLSHPMGEPFRLRVDFQPEIPEV